MDGRDILEELHGHVDRHVQHVVDILAFVFHFERLAVVTVSPACLATHVDVGQEFISMVWTPAPRHSSQRPPLTLNEKRPALKPRIWASGVIFEQFADVGKKRSNRSPGCCAAYGRWATGRRRPVCRYVRCFDAVVFERLPEGAVELLRKDRAQRLVDERRLAGTADARHADELAEREFGRDVLEVVAPRPADHDALPRAFAKRFGDPDTAASGEVIGRDGIGTQDVVDRTRGHDVPALRPARGDVDDEVGGMHHVLVVFDDDHRVAGIAQLLQLRIRRRLSRWCRPIEARRGYKAR